MRMTAAEVRDMGLVDDVIAEPEGGAQSDDGGKFAETIKAYLADSLRGLMAVPADELVRSRYAKIRSFGQDSIVK